MFAQGLSILRCHNQLIPSKTLQKYRIQINAQITKQPIQNNRGLVNIRRGSASPAILLRLAEATATLGETDVAREYIDQSKVHGPERDAVVADVVTAICQDRRVSEARELLEQIHDEEAKVQAWYAVAKAQANEPSARLSVLFERAEVLTGDVEKAAAFAGVASALLPE